MARSMEPDVAAMYHLHSSNSRARVPELEVDDDHHPLRTRSYPGSSRIDLPGRDFDLAMPLGEALRLRRSTREYRRSPMPLELVGRLLYATYGIRGVREIDGHPTFDRPVPSAGGLYPLELYVATQEVEGLSDGVYHYDARSHQLELRRSGCVHPELADMTIGQDMIRDANIVLVIAGVFGRTMWKYGQRGYRYVLLDAGHVGQSLYLLGTAMGLGVVTIGGFFDRELGALIGIPLDEEQVVYLGCVGWPRPTVSPIASETPMPVER